MYCKFEPFFILNPPHWPKLTSVLFIYFRVCCLFFSRAQFMCAQESYLSLSLSLISSSHQANLSSGLLASVLRIRQHLILALVHWLCLFLSNVAGINFVLVIQVRNYFIGWSKLLIALWDEKIQHIICLFFCDFCISEAFFILTVCLSTSAVSFLCPLHSWTTGEEMAKDILQHRYDISVKYEHKHFKKGNKRRLIVEH